MGEIPKSTFFIFAETEVDKRGKLYKAVNKQGTVVEFGTQNEQLLTKWITGRIAKEGKKIATDAFELFLAMTGSDMEYMVSGIDPKESIRLYIQRTATVSANRPDLFDTPELQTATVNACNTLLSAWDNPALLNAVLAQMEQTGRIGSVDDSENEVCKKTNNFDKCEPEFSLTEGLDTQHLESSKSKPKN